MITRIPDDPNEALEAALAEAGYMPVGEYVKKHGTYEGQAEYRHGALRTVPKPKEAKMTDLEETTNVTQLPAERRPQVFNMAIGPAGLVPSTFEDVFRLAKVIHASGLAQHLKSEAAITVVLMTGLELGLKPMAALSGIGVINGKPAIYGDIAMAIIRATGQLEDWEETFEGEPYQDNYTAICMMKRAGQKPVTRKFSVAQAKRARLWDDRETVTRRKDGNTYTVANDAPWYRFPDRMLQMRARGFCQRDTFQDALRGVPIFEELHDISGDDMNQDAPQPRSTVARFSERPSNLAMLAPRETGGDKPREIDMPSGLQRAEPPSPDEIEGHASEAPQKPADAPVAEAPAETPAPAQDAASAQESKSTAHQDKLEAFKWDQVVKAFGLKIDKLTLAESVIEARTTLLNLNEDMPTDAVARVNQLTQARIRFLEKQTDIEDVTKVAAEAGIAEAEAAGVVANARFEQKLSEEAEFAAVSERQDAMRKQRTQADLDALWEGEIATFIKEQPLSEEAVARLKDTYRMRTKLLKQKGDK